MYAKVVPSLYDVVEILAVSSNQHENFMFYELYTINVGCFECSRERIKAYCRKIRAMYSLLLLLIC